MATRFKLDFTGIPDEESPLDFTGIPDVGTDLDFTGIPEDVSVGSQQPSEQPMTQQSFMTRHPNVYGATATAWDFTKAAIPYSKYVDPNEREKFMNLVGHGEGAKWYQPKTKLQAQVRDMLLQNLEAVVEIGTAGSLPFIKGVEAPITKAGQALVKRFLPKTYERLAEFGAKRLPAFTGQPKIGAAGDAIKTGAQAPSAVETVITALKEAKPKRAQQEALYTLERGKKIKKAVAAGKKLYGEDAYRAKLSKMGGPMERVEYDSIRKKVGQEKIHELFAMIDNSKVVTDEFDRLTAGRGLGKMFGEFGGGVPTESELAFLNDIFGDEFVKTVLSKRSLFVKAKEAGLELANIPRSLMASFDLSAPLRQGVFFIGRPKRFAPAFKDMFKYFVSEKSFAALSKNITARPTYRLMKDSGLAITELGKSMAKREESFMSSWAEKIPIIGKGVRASSRAYTGFLNKLRADVFDDFVKKGAELGIDDPKFLKDAANFINHATGRGTLGGLEKSAVPLNALFFSPRLIASRINLMNPFFYAKLHPKVRKEALKDLFKFASIASSVAGLAALGGAKVGTDPRSADFMKLKFGNKRYDVLGGFQQPIRAAAQFASGEVVSSTTGKVITLGEGYKPLTALDIAQRLLESKTSPVASFAIALMRGRTAIGEKMDVPTEIANRFIPMVMQDMKDFYDEEGAKGIPMVIPAIFGVGAMSYGGVQSFGLKGKDHSKLNAELNRLKTSMGYPSTSAFGQELTNKEYKLLKEKTGNEIAKALTEFISRPGYKPLRDEMKIKFIERFVDSIKEKTKMELFPDKQRESKTTAMQDIRG